MSTRISFKSISYILEEEKEITKKSDFEKGNSFPNPRFHQVSSDPPFSV